MRRIIRRLRNVRMTPLTILVIVVGSLLVSGGAFATASTLITGKQVKDHSLTGRDIKNRSLHRANFDKQVQAALKARAQRGLTGAQGAAGANGTNGANGATGAKGATGATGARGATGATGATGNPGNDGQSAYDLWLTTHPGQSEDAFLAAIRGENGKDSIQTAVQLWAGSHGCLNGGWRITFSDGTDAIICNGKDGDKGDKGDDGVNGSNGKSAYELAQESGFTGTFAEWMQSLHGKDGVDGANGANGINGSNGKDAYQLAVDNGYPGTFAEWMQSLHGKDGVDGANGTNGVDGKDGAPGQDGTNGKDGAPGQDGKDGAPGQDGTNGKSAFELWKVENNLPDATMQDFLTALKGAPGERGADGKDGAPGQDGKDGAPGQTGAQGPQGPKGDSGTASSLVLTGSFDDGGTFTLDCPTGYIAMGGGVAPGNASNAVRYSNPARINGNRAQAWAAATTHANGKDGVSTIYVVCAPAS